MKISTKHFRHLFIVSLLTVLILTNNTVSQNPQNNNRTNTADEKLKIIDAHIHGVSEKQWKEAGIVGGVIMPQSGNKIPNSSSKNVVRCLGLDYPIKIDTVKKDLDSKEYGCIKIFLGYSPNFFYANDPQHKEVYELLKTPKYKMPVVFHTGDPQDQLGKIKYADPWTLDEVAVENREITFVIAHCGNPWFQTAAEVAYKNKNVFLECSALMTGDVSRTSETMEQTKKERKDQVNMLITEPIKWVFNYVENPRKIMFGSDYRVISEIKPYVDAYKQAIPKKHWNTVFFENAVCVYGFDKKFPTDFKEVKCKEFWDSFKKDD